MDSATNDNVSVAAEWERLEKLLAEPALTVTVAGGGIPSANEVKFDGALLIERSHVERLILVLKRVTAAALRNSKPYKPGDPEGK